MNTRKPKRTPWFPGDTEPARPGIYRVKKRFGQGWASWNGTKWSALSLRRCAPDLCVYPVTSGPPVLKWYGLAEEPK